jgi:F0F1-type ATP synthase membrane subunit b/b'
MQTTDRNAEYNRLMDAARERAHELRRQAIRDAWTGAEDALARAMRSATRFARSAARHARAA